MRLRTALALLLACAGSGLPLAAEGPGARPPGAVEGLLQELAGPFRRQRQAAVEALIGELPAARPAVLRAFEQGGDELRAELASVLAADGSPEALTLLLSGWCTGSDGLAAAVRAAVLTRPDGLRAALPGLAAQLPPLDAAPRARPLAVLTALLERDLVEATFLSRRSKSGGTGSYRGQFSLLRPWRETALAVCFHLLRDWELRVPGTHSAGGYRWLRPVRDVLDPWEVRDLALTALADLALPSDSGLIADLARYHRHLEELRSGQPDGGPFDADPERAAFYEGVLALLCRLDPERWTARVRERIDELWVDPRSRMSFSVNNSTAAMLALKAGFYAEAVERYGRIVRAFGNTSPATDHYNLACAFCSWSLEPGTNDPARLRERALDELTKAVSEGWLDLPWMQEDGDLDPIRESPRFRALEERMRLALNLPDPAPAQPPAGPR